MGNKWYDYISTKITGTIWANKAGNYALGFERENSFIPKYVGRSDSNLSEELIAHLHDKSHHKKFMFSYAQNRTEAYHKECKNFHDFVKQLENDNHPATPGGLNLRCSICGK